MEEVPGSDFWLLHHRDIQPGVADHVLLQAWQVKSDLQKAEWLQTFNAALAASKAARDAVAISSPMMMVVTDRVDNATTKLSTTDDLRGFLSDRKRAIGPLKSSAAALELAADRWNDVVNVSRRHPPEPNGLYYPMSERDAARLGADTLDGTIQDFEGYADCPPIPRNPGNDVRMIRETDVPNNRMDKLRRANWQESRVYEKLQLYDGDNEQNWKPYFCIGGGMSKGCLWVHLNEHGEVNDRVFRKDSWLSFRSWKDPTRFHGQLTSYLQRLPNELECHGRLSSKEGIVPLRTSVGPVPSAHDLLHWVDDSAMTYKVYIEWCQHQSLSDLIHMYERANADIPEPFIWCVAEALAIAGYQMANNAGFMQNGSGPQQADIVHRDWKPGNVFLAAPRADMTYPYYPRPLLGDFGLAFISNHNAANPAWYHDAGTQGYQAPEQSNWRNIDTLEQMYAPKLDERTNVFGYGLVLRQLVMGNTESPPEPLWGGDPSQDQTLAIPPERQVKYSPGLTNLVHACLRYNPVDRPTFAGILQFLNNLVGEGDGQENLTQSMRSGRFGNVVPMCLPQNTYANGSHIFQLPPAQITDPDDPTWVD